MNLQQVKEVVGNLPNMTLEQAERMRRLIHEYRVGYILELGFCHGVSTCYLAAALAEEGGKSIVTIDLESARHNKPNVEELLSRLGLRDQVTVYYEPTSYTWRMMRFLEQSPQPKFDLCYIDGAHSWFVDALAFFLVDCLLRPGGLVIFDDLDWTYETSPSLKHTELVHKMPPDERSTPQVRMIYELLVKTHPSYHQFHVESGWAIARKRDKRDITHARREIITERVIRVEKAHVGLGHFLSRCFDSMRARWPK